MNDYSTAQILCTTLSISLGGLLLFINEVGFPKGKKRRVISGTIVSISAGICFGSFSLWGGIAALFWGFFVGYIIKELFSVLGAISEFF